jgi:tetratricopeptide (TPR) repeat protein
VRQAASPPVDTAGLVREAVAHHQAGRIAEASALYQRVLEKDPGNADALHLSGLIAQQLGQLDAAVELIRMAIAIKPSAAMYYNLGLALQAAGDFAAAAEAYRKAIALNPAESRAHGNLGAVLQAQGDIHAAIACYRKALALKPDDFRAHGNLGAALQQAGDTLGAVDSFRRALSIDPDDVSTLNNLGHVLREQEHLDEAIECLRKAVALKPDYAAAYSNLGNALQDLGALDEALASFQRAIELEPDYVEARWNESLALLMAGRLEEGWAAHDWRLLKPDHQADFRGLFDTKPLYAGEPLAGKTLLAWAEQGLGDEIFFAGVLPDVIRAAGHCVVECDARLIPLYQRSFPGAEFVPKQSPAHERTRQPDIDWQTPIGSLPRWFRPTLESFPRAGGYLVADPRRVDVWRQRLAALGPEPKVGIGWRSMRRSTARDLHYTDLDQWAPILSVPGVTFVSLQYDECRAELDAARRRFGVEIHVWDDLDQRNDLESVSALMTALDLVIGPTTTPQIMAGALGVPTWMLLSEFINWKNLGTGGWPMFPSLTPVWRPRQTSWDPVLERTAGLLHHWSRNRA